MAGEALRQIIEMSEQVARWSPTSLRPRLIESSA